METGVLQTLGSLVSVRGQDKALCTVWIVLDQETGCIEEDEIDGDLQAFQQLLRIWIVQVARGEGKS